MAKKKVVAVSGGFDPIHSGHIRLFEAARMLGDELVVILNNDNWLRKKKKHIFMNQKERAAILWALGAVDRVILTTHKKDPSDMSVCADLERLKPDVFANGGDRKKKNIPELDVCKRLGITMAYNVGDREKMQSSSWLLENYFLSRLKDSQSE